MTQMSHYGRGVETLHGAATLYDSKELTEIARSTVKGRGRYKGWDIRMSNTQSPVLLAYFLDKSGNKCQLQVAI